jgi:hypothetical protein
MVNARAPAKENPVRKIVSLTASAVLLSLALPSSFAKTPSSSSGSPGTIVIVFKDGHRQSFSLSDIDRVEFPAGATAAVSTGSANSALPSRARFLGKWECGDGSGNTFTMILEENGNAHRSIGDIDGKWVYVDGEAHVTWDDGASDAIRKVGSKYQKFAYKAGKSFTDVPANVTEARNTSTHPI